MKTRREFLRGTTGLGALVLSGGKLWTHGGLVTLGSMGAPLVMVGGKSSTAHPAGVIVAAFTNPDGTHPTTLDITSLNDGASNTKYTVDQFNNVLTAATPPATSTDPITITGTLNGTPFTDVPFLITVIDGATATIGPQVVFTPASGAGAVTFVTPFPTNLTYYPIDISTPPATASVVGQLSIADDPTGLFPSPVFSQQEIAGSSTANLNVSSSGVVTTTSYLISTVGLIHGSWVATHGSNHCFGESQFFVTTTPHVSTSAVSATVFSSAASPTISAALSTSILNFAQYAKFASSGFTPSIFNGNLTAAGGTSSTTATFLVPGASVSASTATNVLTIHNLNSGSAVIGLEVYGVGVTSGVTITTFGTGTGGDGTYTLSSSVATVANEAMWLLPPGSGVFNATIVSGAITVDASPLAQPTVGQTIYGVGIPANTTLLTYDNGTGLGTVSDSGLSVADEAMTSLSLPTVNGSISVSFTPAFNLFTSMVWSAGVVTATLPPSSERFFLPGAVVSVSGTIPTAYNGIVELTAGSNGATVITWALASDPGPVTVLGQFDTQFILPQNGVAAPAVFVTSTAAPTDGTCVVAAISATLYDECTTYLQEDAGGLFRMTGTEETPHNYSVCGQLSPGTYSLSARCMGKETQYSMSTAFDVLVLDATPTAGCSISASAASGLLNNANLGTVIATASVSGITDGTWCLHQTARMGFTLTVTSSTTAQVTNVLPLQWGKYSLTFVCSDGAGNNAQATVTFIISKKVGPTVTIAAGLPNSTPYTGPNNSSGNATYPDLISFFTDLQAQSASQIACALSGAQVKIEQNPGGSWVNQEILDNFIQTPIDIYGDPTSSTRIDISNSPTVVQGEAFLQIEDVDFTMTHILGRGMHDFTAGSPNARFVLYASVTAAGGTSRIRLTDCDIQDNDHGIQGGGPGAICEIHSCLFRQNGAQDQTHALYFLNGAYIEYVDSVGAIGLCAGQILKSRAVYGKVVNSAVMGLNGGTTSCPVNICNGGYYLFANCTFQLEPNDANYSAIEWHDENQIQNTLVDVVQTYYCTFVVDDVDSQQRPVGLALDSRYCATNVVMVDTGSVFFGGVANCVDLISGAYLAGIGTTVTTSQLSIRPVLPYLDPATGIAPVWPVNPPYKSFMGQHTAQTNGPALTYANQQSVQGTNSTQGNIINVSASVASGAVIETFAIVTGPVAIDPPATAALWITVPVWAIGTDADSIDSNFAPDYSLNGNTAGLAMNASTGALTTTVGSGGLALGPRKVVVGATQSGKTSKARNFTIMVTA